MAASIAGKSAGRYGRAHERGPHIQLPTSAELARENDSLRQRLVELEAVIAELRPVWCRAGSDVAWTHILRRRTSEPLALFGSVSAATRRASATSPGSASFLVQS